MRTYTVYQVDAFTHQLFAGNPAGVVYPANGLSEAEMQQIARELNNSETAFVFTSTEPDYDVWIRFFTPQVEVPICGHATVAAHYVRALNTNLPSTQLMHKTGVGILPIEIMREEDAIEIMMTQGKIEFSEPFDRDTQEAILAALGLALADLNPACPMQIVSTGHAKVLIGVRDLAVLDRIKLDTTELTRLSAKINCNGYFVFTFDDESAPTLTYGRMFAPAIGITEDPVTGNANGPLGAYLVHHKLVEHDNQMFEFVGRQGTHMNRPGQIRVQVLIEDAQPVTVKVGGKAVLVFQTEIVLP